jgi:hypothetical protein
MVIPVILIGIGVFYVYIRAGLVNTMTGIVLAHTLLALPFVVVTVLSGLQTFDMRQEQVARSLGAPWLSAFMRVTFPAGERLDRLGRALQLHRFARRSGDRSLHRGRRADGAHAQDVPRVFATPSTRRSRRSRRCLSSSPSSCSGSWLC